MNFLAHIFLSCSCEEVLVGNFLADFLRKKESDQLPEAYRQGIILHHDIDSYTDQHPEVLKGVRRLYPRHSKYAPVIIDIFYDFFLIKNWSQFSDESLSGFTQKAYEILLAHLPVMPERLRPAVESMVAANWLESYGTEAGINYTFERMQKRVSRPELLAQPVATLRKYEAEMDAEFLRFFPEAMSYVEGRC